jgi:hypothetical protein
LCIHINITRVACYVVQCCVLLCYADCLLCCVVICRFALI